MQDIARDMKGKKAMEKERVGGSKRKGNTRNREELKETEMNR